MTDRRTIRKKSKGQNVIELQKLLNRVLPPSPKLSIDGDYGEITEKAVKGDIVVFTFSHIGIVESNAGSMIKTIEGNTDTKGNREGVEVAWKNRSMNIVKAFIRLPMTTMGLDRYIVNAMQYC